MATKKSTANRDRLLTLRVNEAEYRRLGEVADYFGLGASSAIRMLLKKAHEAILRERREARRRSV